jgi:hypothetical protein
LSIILAGFPVNHNSVQIHNVLSLPDNGCGEAVQAAARHSSILQGLEKALS